MTSAITYSGYLPPTSAGITATASYGGQAVSATISSYTVNNGQGTCKINIPSTLAVPNTGVSVTVLLKQYSATVFTRLYAGADRGF